MSEKEHRRHRSSFDYGYETKTPLGKRHSHHRSFSEKRARSPSNSFNDDSYASIVKKRKISPHPLLDGYQLIGDSLLLRFAEQVLFERCIYDNGMRYLGLCVSGQTIEELKERVENKFSPVGEKIILLIGTNNILQGASADDMRDSLVELLDLLDERAKRIVILTLPPIPKLENDGRFWYKFNSYNGFIKTLNIKRENVTVKDISQLFLEEGYCNMDYFERWYDRLQRRPDLIHLNRAGLLKIKTHLLKNNVLSEEES
ncbi:hypothetical protein R5R35_009773 [Gryllus longicercus]|uniref:OSK domain-containing protein n=1 Tax=Gryllus longicercus TaxID=2509291 RepID=A0AAN9Z477_9ORTH